MDNDEKVMIKDEFGNEVEVHTLSTIEVNGKEYLLYYTDSSPEEKNIYALRIVKNASGEEDLEIIEDEDEKRIISSVIDDLTEDNNL